MWRPWWRQPAPDDEGRLNVNTIQLGAEAAVLGAGDDGYARRRRFLTSFFLVMCAFRDSIFITGPIFVFRLVGSVKSGGVYGSALLFGGMLSFLVMGAVVDRLGWRRVSLVAAGTLAVTNVVLAATALGLLPYQRELDIILLLLIFFCGSAFYLIPEVLINRLLVEDDRAGAYSKSGSLFPAVALMLSSALLFGLERAFGDRALGLTMASAGILAAASILLIHLQGSGEAEGAIPAESPHRGLRAVLGEWLSGFRFIASDPAMRLLLVFTCCVALALAPHNVFITAILKSAFAIDDGGVAVAQFTLASVEVLAAWAFPLFARAHSLRALGLIAVTALVMGNGVAAMVLSRQEGAAHGDRILLVIYIAAHVGVFVGFTFAAAWIRMVRGKATPLALLGRTAGAMSVLSQLCGLLFSLVVSFAGAAVATHAFYVFCVGIMALVGGPMALAIAKRLAAGAHQGA